MAEDPTELPNQRSFTWNDGPRVLHFREGLLSGAATLLTEAGWEDYELLTTPRALEEAPAELAGRAAAVHHVPAGKVAETAAAVIGDVSSNRLVAFGGGRVIDSAKAIAAVREGETAAIPTTLSGAEMTAIHRLPEGHSARRLNRPTLVIADPLAMTGLPERPLRATALNSLGHGADALFGPAANPFSTQAALRGIRLVAASLDEPEDSRDRAALALGSLFCACAIDGAGLSLHHAVCQELVRGVGIAHAETNATMLPHTMAAMREREPAAMEALADALGTGADGLPERLTDLGGGRRRLAELEPDRSGLDAALDTIHERVKRVMGDPLSREDLAELVETAW